MCRQLINSRTPEELLSAMNDVNQDQEAVSGAQPVEVDAGELSRLQQLIILPGEEGGILTQTEFMFSKFCAEEKLKKTTSDHLLSTRLCDRRHSCGNNSGAGNAYLRLQQK
jgi:hypothetical protein